MARSKPLRRPCAIERNFACALAVLFAASALGGIAGCGYTPLHSATAGESFYVSLVASKVPDAIATDEVLAGMREELARTGSLATGGPKGYPRIEVEVLRSDETSEGIAAESALAPSIVAKTPRSRASRLGLVARAWVVRTPGGPRERDTADVRAFETVAVASDARAATFQATDTLRVTARRLGKRLAARLVGLPSASDE